MVYRVATTQYQKGAYIQMELMILAFQLVRVLNKVIPILFVVGFCARYGGIAVISVPLLFAIGFVLSFGWVGFWVWSQRRDTVDAFGIAGIYAGIFLVLNIPLMGMSWFIVYLMYLTGLTVEVWMIYLLFLYSIVRIATHLSGLSQGWFGDLFEMFKLLTHW